MKLLTELDSLDNVKDGETRKLVTKATSSGSGNVVSSISVSGDTVTYTKGVTAVIDANYVHTDNNFTTTLKNKLDGIASGAEVNQNAFSNVKVGSTTIAADSKTDTLELVAGSNVTLTPDATNDKVTIAATDTTYESKAAVSGGTAVSLVTTGEKYTWNNKQNALSTQTAYSAKGTATKVPQITTNTLGQVTKIEEVTITQPTVNNGTLTIQKNGTNVQTFSANQSGNATANITVPTKTSELTNDSNYITNTGSTSGNAGTATTLKAVSQVGSNENNTAGWYKVASSTLSGYGNQNVLYYIKGGYTSGYAGILELEMRANSTNIECWQLKWLVRLPELNANKVIMNITNMTWTLYVYNPSGRYGRVYFTEISNRDIGGNSPTFPITYYNSDTPETTEPVATVTATDGSIVARSAGDKNGDDITTTYYKASNPNGYTSNVGTITGITMNGASKGTSGVVDLGTVLTSHQSIKTINNNTITGTGNVSVGTITKVQANGTDVASSGTANIPAASTGAYGVTKLSNATDSTSEALAATPKAVKAAYDLAASKGTGTITGVSVNGTSVATSGVANITSVPASILSGAIPSAVTATTQSASDNSTKIATTAFVKTAIDNLPEPMVFKGTLGTGGTITALPTNGTASVGDTYKVITAGTYASKAAKVGDTFICLTKTSSANTWELIPSGDEPSGTVTSVKIEATGPIAVNDSSAITTSGTRTISHANSGVTAGTYRSVTVNATGHVTAGTNPTTLSGYGITDAKIASGVITLGSNTITPLTASSTLDATKVSGTLPTSTYTDTKNTAGSTDSSSKLFLIGATSQAANPQTYSQDTAYVGTDGHLYSNSVQVVNLSGSQALTNKTYNGYTLAAACAKAVVTSIDTSASLPTSNAVKTFVEGKGYVTTDTKNTAGSTDTSSKIFLIGATSQAANPQTYSDNEIYATSGVLTTKSVQVGGTAATMQYNSTDKCIEFVFA